MSKINSINPIFQDFVLPKLSDNKTENNGYAIVEHAEKKSHGSTIAYSLAGIAIFALILSKGLGGGLDKKMKKIINHLQAKIFTKSLMDKQLNLAGKTMINLQKTLVWLFNSLQSISNITPIKDTLTMKLFKLTAPTMTLGGKISKIFRKIAISSSRRAYEKTFTSFDEVCGYLKSLSPNKNSSVYMLVSEAEKAYHTNFFASARHERLKKIKTITQGLEEKLLTALYDKKEGALRNPKRFKGYITFDLIAKEKFNFHQELLELRRIITNTGYHKKEELGNAFNGIKSNINTDDLVSVNLISTINADFHKYKKIAGEDNKIIQKEVIESIIGNLDKLKNHLINFAQGTTEYPKQTTETLINYIVSIKNVLKNDEKAFLQKSLDLIETMYSKNSKEYQKAYKKIQDFSKKFDVAIEREGVGLLEKIAEIEVGSAPTDVMGLMIPAIIAVVWTAKAEGKAEKVATALQTSIPIIGGIATALYGTTRMYTGVQNLTLAIVSGILLNLVGTGLNKAYKAKLADKPFL